MQACQAYQSCPICTHAWSKPLNRTPVYDGFRSFLPKDHVGRQKRVHYKGHVYEYKFVHFSLKSLTQSFQPSQIPIRHHTFAK